MSQSAESPVPKRNNYIEKTPKEKDYGRIKRSQ